MDRQLTSRGHARPLRHCRDSSREAPRENRSNFRHGGRDFPSKTLPRTDDDSELWDGARWPVNDKCAQRDRRSVQDFVRSPSGYGDHYKETASRKEAFFPRRGQYYVGSDRPIVKVTVFAILGLC
ncbi:hypothetical protein CTA2_11781 [Colletotrichum tanaceti]|uniref:Uncharacterized protein n=1 Tax=Colletotrichum tanaceti TaxID=1306861 RepID=A0A4U6X0A9_9PEZI|nr:hypothetical protein CTA2_11781 [Colletotrichum tanaceti]TKW48798.1 hypothetical protein CTA1_6271 [Colletotrichum tanaceti]